MSRNFYRTWAEINLDHIAHNAREIRRITSPQAEVMGVVKADAYGHGVKEVAHTLLENGVTRLAVSMLDEAIQLRQSGVSVPILVLSDIEPERVDEILHYDVTQTIFEYEFAEMLSRRAASEGKKATVHIKIDTGMGRIGFDYAAAPQMVKQIYQCDGLYVEGLFTHFATSDEADTTYTQLQFRRFLDICRLLEQDGIQIPVKHVANSAAIIRFPEMHLDMVRAGVILYGLHPSSVTQQGSLDLRPAMSLKSKVSMVKSVPAGSYLSYGCTYCTKRETMVATIPIGYADGYTRLLGNRARVLIHGQYAPILGRICMDQCLADVTELTEAVQAGDEVVLFGQQEEKQLSADEVARLAETINYELICIVGKRVPRIYMKNGHVVNVLNYLLGSDGAQDKYIP